MSRKLIWKMGTCRGNLWVPDLQMSYIDLTHWGWVMHICICKLTIISSGNGLLPGQCQAIIWINAGILWIGPLGTNFSEIVMRIHTFSFRKLHLKMSVKSRPFCLGPNVLTHWGRVTHICVSKLTILGSHNGLLPGQCQAIISTNAGILLIGPLGTNYSEMNTFHWRKCIRKYRLKNGSHFVSASMRDKAPRYQSQ